MKKVEFKVTVWIDERDISEDGIDVTVANIQYDIDKVLRTLPHDTAIRLEG
jgi:hypothetical protein